MKKLLFSFLLVFFECNSIYKSPFAPGHCGLQSEKEILEKEVSEKEFPKTKVFLDDVKASNSIIFEKISFGVTLDKKIVVSMEENHRILIPLHIVKRIEMDDVDSEKLQILKGLLLHEVLFLKFYLPPKEN